MNILGLKIAHCSDLHIGAKISGIDGEKSRILGSEVKEVFFGILDVCEEENIDALLIAGDFFDDTNVNSSDVREIISKMSRCKYRIFISPGNHDPFTFDSPYVKFEWPENVFIFRSRKPEKILIEEKNAVIWGSAFEGRYEWAHLMRDIKTSDETMLNICLMHGDLNSAEESRYNLISHADIKLSGMDYIALGHIHKRTEIQKSANTYYAYSGGAQGTGFDELGEKGFYIGTVSKGTCDLKFRRACKRRFEEVHIDVSDCVFVDDFVSKVVENLFEKYGENYDKNLYKVIFEGSVPESASFDAVLIASKLCEKVFYVQIVDNTHPKIDIEKLKFKTDFKSLFIKKMIKKIEESTSEREKEMNEKALKIGLKAFEGDVKYIEN
ncbi:MAG: DNA repair exonuclease [Clostridia bacterium]|nr:DNA repair exonuclease [Clostridia bacterium]